MTKDNKDRISKQQLLLEASRLGRFEELEALLSQSNPHRNKKKVNPLVSLRKPIGLNSIRDPATGFTCLHHAALNGHAECVKLILAYGAKLNAVDYKGSSALHLAAWAGNLEVVRVMLAHNILLSLDSDNLDKQSVGQSMSKENEDADSWTTALGNQSEPVDIDLCNNDNQTPLSLAAHFGHDLVVEEIVKHGASVDIRNIQNESALDLACLGGWLETSRILLDSSAQLRADLRRAYSAILVSSSSSSIKSPLFNRQTELVRTQSMFSDVISQRRRDSKDSSGSGSNSNQGIGAWTSLLRRNSAATSASADIKAALSRSGSNKQKKQSPGSSPLSAASSSSSSSDSKKQAISGQANSQASTQKSNSDLVLEEGLKLLGHSPLHYATRHGHHNLVSMLLYSYKANLLQVTSLGSVLHEIALSQGKHNDLIGVFFQFIANRHFNRGQAKQDDKFSNTNQHMPSNGSNSNNNTIYALDEMLNKFLNLKNDQNQTVFQLLNQINNRSAQETRELICRFSDQILKLQQQQQQQQQQQHQIQQPQFSSTMQYQQQQQFPHQTSAKTDSQTMASNQNGNDTKNGPKPTILRNNINLVNQHHYDTQGQILQQSAICGQQQSCNNNSQYQTSQQRDELVKQIKFSDQQNHDTFKNSGSTGKQFSDMKQINSFVTMKRAPKLRQDQNQDSKSALNQLNNNSQTQTMNLMPFDRSFDLGQVATDIDLERPNNQQDQAQNSRGKHNNHGSNLITRSVSNLSNWLSQGLGQDKRQANASIEQAPSPLQDPGRQFRSRSRDIGTILLESKRQQQQNQQKNSQILYQEQQQKQQQQQQQQQRNQQLYEPDQMHQQNIPMNQSTSQSTRGMINQSKLDNEHHASFRHGANNLIRGYSNDYTTENPNGRKAINRHYHVYEPQQYPNHGSGKTMNLIQNESGSQLIKVMQPVIDEHEIEVRASSAQNAIPGQMSDTNYAPSMNMDSRIYRQQHQSIQQNAFSRLSLNLDQNPYSISEARSTIINCPGGPLDNMHYRQMSDTNPNQKFKQQYPLQSKVRPDLIELQRNLQYNNQVRYNQTMGQNSNSFMSSSNSNYSIPNSTSVASHLTDSCSSQQQFDATRRAIMNDFDNMIGQELLNRDHGTIIGSNGPRISSSTSLPQGTGEMKSESVANNSQSHRDLTGSILTGITLNMDQAGNNLTVSGTRVSFCRDQNDIEMFNQQPISFTELDMDERSNDSLQSSTSQSSRPAPPPPPRPSLASQRSLGSQSRAMSHDVRSEKNQPKDCRPPPIPPQPAIRSSQRISRQHHQNNSASQNSCIDISASESRNNSTESIRLVQMGLGSGNSCSESSRNKPENVRCKTLISKTTLDNDSGVCTSNSPASLSHDSDNFINESNSKADSNEPKSYDEFDPDIPSNVCLSTSSRQSEGIHRASNMDAAISDHPCSPPSPKTAQMCVEEAMIPLARRDDILESNHELEMQETSGHMIQWLKDATCQAFEQHIYDSDYDNVSTSDLDAVCPLTNNGDIIKDREPVDSASDDGDVEDILQTSPEVASLESDNSLSLHKDNGSIDSETLKKEVMLSVVFDKHIESDTNELQTFLIDPSELKKMTAIEDSSGFIRITLRKRPNDSDQTITSTDQNEEIITSIKADDIHASQKVSEIQDPQNMLSHNLIQQSKKSRMASFDEKHEPTSKDRSDIKQRQMRRYSEIISPKEIPFSFVCHDELANWFSRKLVGLAEYQTNFISLGFDNLKFLNHPDLMNDKILNSIGINNEHHRVIILDTIHNDLAPLELDRLVSQIQVDSSLKHLLKVLEINPDKSWLVDYQKMTEETFADENSINRLRCLAMEKMCLGHRIRLTLALDHIDKSSNQNNAKAKSQISEDSTSKAEIDVEMSPASSSSSSKNSIESVVLNKTAIGLTTASIDPNQAKVENKCLDEPKKNTEQSQIQVQIQKTPPPAVINTSMLPKPIHNSALCSVVKRIEQDNSCKSPPQPIAAIRKASQPKMVDTGKKFLTQKQDSERNSESNESGIEKDRKTMLKPNILKDQASIKFQETKPVLQSNKPNTSSSESRPIRKLDAIRMSFERQIEEQASSRKGLTTNDRPGHRFKPPPPAKPANLIHVENKFT